jgi:hypothetical protein
MHTLSKKPTLLKYLKGALDRYYTARFIGPMDYTEAFRVLLFDLLIARHLLQGKTTKIIIIRGQE